MLTPTNNPAACGFLFAHTMNTKFAANRKTKANMKKKEFKWRETLKDFLELMFPVMPTREISELMGLEMETIANAAKTWHLKKERSVILRNKAAGANALNQKKREVDQKSQSFAIKTSIPKAPPPLTAAQIARREKERFVYPPGQLPWRAERMRGPVYVPAGMSYRGQTQRSTPCSHQ